MPVPQLFKWSPRPDQGQTPDGTPASETSSRFGPFGALHNNVRSMVNGSSVYSQSPNPQSTFSTSTTPKIPFLERFRRDQSPAPIAVPNPNDSPRDSSDSRSPLRPQHTAGSYMRAIASSNDPRQPTASQNQNQQSNLDRHPADVPLGFMESGGHQVANADAGVESPEEINERRRRRRHRRRRQQRNDHWVRRRKDRASCSKFVRGTAARGKLMACIISGLFLLTVLAIYLALALSRSDLGQEVHVLFIMIVLATTIFFCHSLIRLCMLILHPPSLEESQHVGIPSMTGPEGFRPIRPIQVHLARDEDLDDGFDDPERGLGERGLGVSASGENEAEGGNIREKPMPPPPPAYGLWRSSVRADPNLLHWQRVNAAAPLPNNRSTSALSTNSNNSNNNPHGGSAISVARSSAGAGAAAEESSGPRPPSYVSEDGVSYIVEAAPRSVAPSHTGVSDIHPAWRPGYAVSEVPMNQWPGRR